LFFYPGRVFMDLSIPLPEDQDSQPEHVLDTGKIWPTAWKVFSSNWLPIFWITLAIYILLLVLSMILTYQASRPRYDPSLIRWVSYLFMYLRVYVTLIAVLAISHLTEKAICGERSSLKEAVSRAFARYGIAIWTNLISSLIILGFSLLLIIPGIVKSVQYAFINYVVVLRDLGGKEARQYSLKVVGDYGFEVFGLIVLIGLLSRGVTSAIGYLLSSYIPDMVGVYFAFDISASFFRYYFTVLMVVLFLDLEKKIAARVDHEGPGEALDPVSSD
jgi:hypothetical protein